MRYVLLGLLVVYGAASAIVVVSMRSTMQATVWWPDEQSIPTAILLTGLLPLAASYVLTDVLDRLRPRLILDPRTPRRLRATLAGLLTGVLGVVLGAAAIMLLEPWVHEGVLLAAGAALAPLPIHLLLARRRVRDTCLACGYDLSATSRLCPECGALGSRA